MLPASAALAAVLAVTIWRFSLDRHEFVAQLVMESDAMAVVNTYYPRRIRLRGTPMEANLRLPTLQSSQPRFGALVLGNSSDSLVSIMLDEATSRNASLLYVDRDNDEDLTNDGEAVWDDVTRTFRMKEVLVEIAYGDGEEAQIVPYPITFYRYSNRLPESVIAYRNGYRKGHIALHDTVYKIALFDDEPDGLFDDLSQGTMVIDINRDGVLDGKNDSDEYFRLADYFAVNGRTYRVKEVSPSGDVISVTSVDTVVFPKQQLSTDLRSPSFRTLDVTGQVVDLEHYRNKVVLLDFWASWCKPWEQELENLKRSYNKFHKRGFEIIGLSLDYDLDHLNEYVASHNVPWPQIADGTAWEMPVVELYKVNALPRNYLLDRNGIIRYKNVRGRKLEAKIYELLNEPEVDE